MSTKNDGGPAYPFMDTQHNVATGEVSIYQGPGGMSLRDRFAGIALQEILGNAGRANINLKPSALASMSYEVADAMIAERSK